MKIIGERGRDDLAKVYIALLRNGDSTGSSRYLVEFVESLQPPIPREQKWVIIVSSQFGCPVGCLMCDAGKEFIDNLTPEEILAQIDYVVRKRYPKGRVPIPKFKIQFARMGEPALNSAVLDVLERLPTVYDAPGLIPCVSTIAPEGSEIFFERLLDIKQNLYRNGRFQLQFSINTTDETKRDELMPMPKWNFAEMASYGARFYESGDRKITLNFAISTDYPVEPQKVREHFEPNKFIIKLTPINPTHKVEENSLVSYIDPERPVSGQELVDTFKQYGYDTILSIGELEENQIGSNCGEFVSSLKEVTV